MKAIKMLVMAALTIGSISMYAQDSTSQKIKSPKQKMEKIQYSCPMHPDMVSNKPGKCSKCGMDLTKSNKEQMKMEVMKMYACPMHPDVTSDKPGKCSKCGMDLKKRSRPM
ncbi:Cu+-exporting ATPase [Hydrobacter penzbergensis]|uniref:Cu+-exporting ATPase n=1 Tax=Hydrobacter penzbergensis TaxID=1235997 RepID=A0A8X8IE74_9BACT|nr:heavy metal-binding domain-containing protein [Hydrobacter penzbergensis]SDW51797.1 Cu+-exporting ATPase [Hydrobacter penzbergensis]